MAYQQPPPSPIEISFWEAAQGLLPKLEREVWIGQYRVDFLIRDQNIVIELYSYAYHHTKQKLTSDAQRERFIQRQGYHIIRFTGPEVYRDAHKCVQEVVAFLETLPIAKEGYSSLTPLSVPPSDPAPVPVLTPTLQPVAKEGDNSLTPLPVPPPDPAPVPVLTPTPQPIAKVTGNVKPSSRLVKPKRPIHKTTPRLNRFGLQTWQVWVLGVIFILVIITIIVLIAVILMTS